MHKAFWGNATNAVIEILKDLDYVNKMVRISMDGANVNWALLDNLSIHQKEKMQMHLT